MAKHWHDGGFEFVGAFYQDSSYHNNHAHLLHKHDKLLELLYVHSGSGVYHVAGDEYRVSAGDLVICQPGIVHGEAPFRHESDTGMETYCCSFRAEEPVKRAEKNSIVRISVFKDSLNSLLPHIYRMYMETPEKTALLQTLSQSVALMVVEEQQLQAKGTVSPKLVKKDKLVRAIGVYIEKNYRNNITLEDISIALHTSESTVSHAFKKHTGMSPMQYVTRRRLGDAQSLLAETDMPIQDIEEQLGFLSSSHFIKMFKKYTGITPREYRKNFRTFSVQKDANIKAK